MKPLKKLKVISVFGTRPEAIKMAPLVLELQKNTNIEAIVAVTAQHREMLDQVLGLFKITPKYDLDIMTKNQTLYEVTTKALLGLKEIFNKEKPDLVLVHGDTTTTFVAALAAFYAQIPIGHVEAGLRTGNKYSPFPEEMNRKLTGSLADLHFAPTSRAKDNLLKENINPKDIFITGNTVIDALATTVKSDYEFEEQTLKDLVNNNKKLILLTTHRRENLGEPMRHVYKALKEVLKKHPEAEVIFPVHKNPMVRAIVNEELANLEQVHLVEPLDYEPFANLMAKAYLVLTDSGGIQEEAPAFGKPVLVLRDTTERPEAIIAGTVKLVGTEFDKVFATTDELLTNQEFYKEIAMATNPYGDGLASKRIVNIILNRFGYENKKITEFV